MAALELSKRTLGQGDLHESFSENGNDDARSMRSSSYAPTDASGMDRVDSDCDDNEDFFTEPVWQDQVCSTGEWGSGPRTRGGGDQGAEDENKAGGPCGNYGIFTANWGGTYNAI